MKKYENNLGIGVNIDFKWFLQKFRTIIEDISKKLEEVEQNDQVEECIKINHELLGILYWNQIFYRAQIKCFTLAKR